MIYLDPKDSRILRALKLMKEVLIKSELEWYNKYSAYRYSVIYDGYPQPQQMTAITTTNGVDSEFPVDSCFSGFLIESLARAYLEAFEFSSDIDRVLTA